MRRTIYIIFALALIGLVIIVSIQNSHEVMLHLLGWKTSTSLILVIFLSFLSGIIISLLLMLPGLRKRNKKST